MMRSFHLPLILALIPAAAQSAGPARADLQPLEQSLDSKLRRSFPESPLQVLGLARGVYLEEYGAVITAELSLIMTPSISPFRPEISQKDRESIHAAKVLRLPGLKQVMRDWLMQSAGSLDRLPPEEQVVLAITIFFHNWEITKGLPQQVLMSAPKKTLVEAATGRLGRAELDTALRIREY
jgi:hypothetical protein